MYEKGSHQRQFVVSMASPDGVVCPKPRRIGSHLLVPPPSPLLHINNQQMEAYDAKAGDELLDIILRKQGSYGAEQHNFQVASSPPFFSGSPPRRASNPVIQDKQFGNVKLMSPLHPIFEPPAPLSPSSRKSGGGCVRVKYSHSPDTMRRVEGFNCRNSCSISAVA